MPTIGYGGTHISPILWPCLKIMKKKVSLFILVRKVNILSSLIFNAGSHFHIELFQESPQAARVKVMASGNSVERRFRFDIIFTCLVIYPSRNWVPLHTITCLICLNPYAVFGLEAAFLHPLGHSSKCGSPKQSKLDIVYRLSFLYLSWTSDKLGCVSNQV